MKRKKSSASGEEKENKGKRLCDRHEFSSDSVSEVRGSLLEWYDLNCRTLPWRTAARTVEDGDVRGYMVWVSEVMLQQTQVATVLKYYNSWMTRWPTLESLAAAPLESVLEAWSGLGYYSRARRLHEGAVYILEKCGGRMPRSSQELLKLPGVGRYTACAIASIAYGELVGLLDGNVSRVLARMRQVGADITASSTSSVMWRMVDQLVDQQRPGDFNQAMMELGATVCSPKSPQCEDCPVRSQCGALQALQEVEVEVGDIEDCQLCLPSADYQPELGVTNYPRKGKKTAARSQETLVVVVRVPADTQTEAESFLMERRPSSGLLASLLQFPSLELPAEQETKEADKLRLLTDKLAQSNVQFEGLQLVDSLVHVFSHIKMTYTVYTCQAQAALKDGILVTEKEFESCGTSTAMRKVFKCYKDNARTGKSVKKQKKNMTKNQKKSLVPTPTKGKGGGKGGGSSKGGKSEAVDLKDLKDCPLDFRKFELVDSAKAPNYFNIFKKPPSEDIGMEDLDGLQLELEMMLSNCVLKKKHLKEESDILANLDKYKGRSKKGPSSPVSGKKVSGKDGGNMFKKMKLNSGKPLETKSSKSGKEEFDPLQNEQIKPSGSEANKPVTPKNETPTKFWQFVEPYCAPIGPDDVKFLEDMLKGYSDMSEYYRVPPLGQHYAIRWAKEDLEAEKSKGGDENKEVKEEGGKVVKKEKGESSPFGELTQRLVQGLMEENLMTQVDDTTMVGKEDDIGTKNSFIHSLKVANGDSLEARLKKELEEQGILEAGEEEDGGPDEILSELTRCQEELKAVAQHNQAQLRRLAKSAREEMARQEIRERLSVADKEVCETYKKIAIARSKKKSPSKKEKDNAWKALKDRETILKQLESV